MLHMLLTLNYTWLLFFYSIVSTSVSPVSKGFETAAFGDFETARECRAAARALQREFPSFERGVWRCARSPR